MGLTFAIDDLYATGWTALDTAGCEFAESRPFPNVDRVRREFDAAGCVLAIKHIQLFDCYRAAWSDRVTGAPAGAVVGQSESEAAVYALAQLRRAAAPTA